MRRGADPCWYWTVCRGTVGVPPPPEGFGAALPRSGSSTSESESSSEISSAVIKVFVNTVFLDVSIYCYQVPTTVLSYHFLVSVYYMNTAWPRCSGDSDKSLSFFKIETRSVVSLQ